MEIRDLPDNQSEDAFELILDPADYELAHSQAKQRGVEYEEYLKMLVHEALHKAKR
jgi:hypothetical protein